MAASASLTSWSLSRSSSPWAAAIPMLKETPLPTRRGQRPKPSMRRAATAGGYVLLPNHPPDQLGHRHQDLVAPAMALGIVHRLEAVQVEVEEGDRASRPQGAGDFPFQLLVEAALVQEGGEAVAARQPFQFLGALGHHHFQAFRILLQLFLAPGQFFHQAVDVGVENQLEVEKHELFQGLDPSLPVAALPAAGKKLFPEQVQEVAEGGNVEPGRHADALVDHADAQAGKHVLHTVFAIEEGEDVTAQVLFQPVQGLEVADQAGDLLRLHLLGVKSLGQRIHPRRDQRF